MAAGDGPSNDCQETFGKWFRRVSAMDVRCYKNHVATEAIASHLPITLLAGKNINLQLETNGQSRAGVIEEAIEEKRIQQYLLDAFLVQNKINPNITWQEQHPA